MTAGGIALTIIVAAVVAAIVAAVVCYRVAQMNRSRE